MATYLRLSSLLKAAVVAICVVTAAACKEKTPEMTLDCEENVSFDSMGGPGMIRFTPHENWSVRSSASWVVLSTTGGLPNGERISVSYTVMENAGADDRSAQITVSSGAVSKTVTISQGKKHIISAGDTRIVLDDIEQTFSVKVKSNVDYDVSFGDATWLRLIENKALTESVITIGVDANPTTSTRTAKLSLNDRSAAGGISIEVHQKGAPIILESSACGLYDSSKGLIVPEGTIQHGLIEGSGSFSFQLVDSKARKYCLFKDIPVSVRDMEVGDCFSLGLEHNYESIPESSMSLELTILRKEGDCLWGWDRSAAKGVIIRIR